MTRQGALMLALCLSIPGVLQVPMAAEKASPLSAFGDLVVGTWEADDSRQVNEWGVGGKLIRSRGYFKTKGEWTLVSEGIWYWDPAQETVRGVHVAIGMPVDLFEYRSRIEGKNIVHDLVAHGEGGGTYIERWGFLADGYRWSLEQERNGETVEVMGGVYEKAAQDPGGE